MKLKIFLQTFGLIAILLTLVPFVGANYWWIRVFDFPHLQLTLLTLVAILVYMIRFDNKSGLDLVLIVALCLCFSYQFVKIVPYTEIRPTSIQDSEINSPENTIKLYTANVLQSNNKPSLLNKEIKHYNADIVLLTETNRKWRDNIKQTVDGLYPYATEVPLNNTYGMLLYSKFELINPQVTYLVSDSIPSIHALVLLPSGDSLQFHAIHPTPPMPQHNPKSTDRDAEMMIIALKAMDSKIPVIVMGDFNDVAWSQTTKLFENVSGLLDMRKGRGLYNTFNAKNILMRWPLDHIFVSEEFRVVEMERGSKINSDHFPFFTVLSLEPELSEQQKPSDPTPSQVENARKMAERGNQLEFTY